MAFEIGVSSFFIDLLIKGISMSQHPVQQDAEVWIVSSAVSSPIRTALDGTQIRDPFCQPDWAKLPGKVVTGRTPWPTPSDRINNPSYQGRY